MNDSMAIEVKGLKKRFRRELLKKDYTTWKSLLLKPFTAARKADMLTVLDGIDLSLPPGRTLAIIGENGSGKSTFLKILAGIYKADEGEVRVKGRVSSLIELGAGFHPEFSGRENVFLNGTILGLSKKEINQRYQQIVLDIAIARLLAGEITVDQAMKGIEEGWEEITEELGRDDQLKAYRATLGR